MNTIITDIALSQSWCNPEQDKTYIFSPGQLTNFYGALNITPNMLRSINLPTTKQYYQVYQIGQLDNDFVGLMKTDHWFQDTWVKMSTAMTSKNMIIDVYNEKGIMLPRFETYYCMTSDNNLLIALAHNPGIDFKYGRERLFVRFYSNAYFSSARSDENFLGDAVEYFGQRITSVEQILTVQSKFTNWSGKFGLTTGFINGVMSERIDLLNIKVGDTVEIVRDSSVKEVHVLSFSDLQTFESILDKKRKYFVPIDQSGQQMIDYQDDIEMFLVDTSYVSGYKGVYYHRNSKDAVRMVTHCDYSLVVDYLLQFARTLQELRSSKTINATDLKLVVHVRDSGYERSLTNEHNRLHELFKIPYYERIQYMLGAGSVVNNWRVEQLENSAYCALMRAQMREINPRLVEDAYGYNSIACLLGNTPTKVPTMGMKQVELPFVLQGVCTVYEYDQDGVMLGYYIHKGDYIYTCVNPNTAMIEAINGVGQYFQPSLFGTSALQLSDENTYRVYMAHYVNGVVDENWQDVTGTDHYEIRNGALYSKHLEYDYIFMVRKNYTFLAYDINIKPQNGIIHFTLSEEQDRGNGVENRVMSVPMGEIDVFIEGKSLIKDIDYYIKFPEIYIVSKDHLKADPDNQMHRIHIRFTGFCDKDLKIIDDGDKGFVVHGVLSNNNRFDIRDDKVQRIVVGGSVKHRDDLVFSETHSGVSVVNAINGLPYSVRDVVVQLKDAVTQETYAFRKKSLEIDKRISDFLTVRLPEPVRSAPSAIVRRYPVYSPFLSKLLHHLKTKMISMADVQKPMSDSDFMLYCAKYEPLLEFDPVKRLSNNDLRYMVVHPHNNYSVVELNLFQYRFLLRAVKLYCDNRVDITDFVAIASLPS